MKNKSFKVDNAIIMAAGLSSRFYPLSLKKPKSLWEVKGEVLIERQIKQLLQAGISDITLVVGYMGDTFDYLKDKYKLELVENPDYKRYNNLSSLMPVLDKIKNTYICSSDNYFVSNPFQSHMTRSTYPLIHNPNQEGEYYVTLDADKKITDLVIGQGQYCMIGQVFFDQNFSSKFKAIMKEAYKKEDVRLHLWEHLYMQHLDILAMHGEIVDPADILEFDTLKDLQKFDPAYLNFDEEALLKSLK